MISESFLIALAMVETGNHVNWLEYTPEMLLRSTDCWVMGDGGKALGPFQIHKITVEEANRILKIKGCSPIYKERDRLDYYMSRSITATVLAYYRDLWAARGIKLSYADLAAMHRWGPSRWKPARTYALRIDRVRAKKIKNYMQELALSGD